MAKLVRDRDGEGHYGCILRAIDPVDGNTTTTNKPIIGKNFYIGTTTASTYSERDWWCTTPVTSITEETEEYIKFKTENSDYTLFK
jgi:hypothetical protein